MAATYIILTSPGLGGAEKRFAELFVALRGRGADLHLVVADPVYRKLLERGDMHELPRHGDRIIRFALDGRRLGQILKSLWPIVKAMPRGSVVHYPLAHFPLVHRLLGHRLVISWVGPFLPKLKLSATGLRYVGLLYLGLAEARLVDVLNPRLRDRLVRFRAWAGRLRVTAGGTFVDLRHFRPAAKRDKVAFLGRIEREKGALRFVEAIASANAALAAEGISPEFVLYGAGGDQLSAVERMLADHPELPARLDYAANPADALADAKLFLSLQRSSNYPSKSLAEAMACGCVPIVTDTGESRLMADPSFATFLPPAFTDKQLAGAIVALLTLPPGEFEARSAAARKWAEAHFRIEVQADYFERLYREAAA